ncbi:MAG: hypothetical protein JRI76_10140, partial [Deltaproteobacteria bacterium]|nr:hypothetical protein [Deltaproteobacteria bacterium]MBW2042374.1 hypothetical protein [Deltaproteobacteria bacterium]
VTRVREYGTLGQCQVLKALGHHREAFPAYGKPIRSSPVFRNLGKVKLNHRIGRLGRIDDPKSA